MKKIFLFGLAATAMLASCSNDETVEMAQQKAIGFSNTFVNNGTRSSVDPSLTTETLYNFAVYGFTQNGQIFDGTEVLCSGGKCTYSPLQYWVADNDYTFGAIAPFSVAENVSDVNLSDEDTIVEMAVAFTNSDDDQVDLLHAAPAQITGVTSEYDTPVAMTFSHQLSKVKFSFVNAVGEAYTVKVRDIKITNAYEKGTLTVAKGGNTWSNQPEYSFTLNFGNAVADSAEEDIATAIEYNETLESYCEKLMIPSDNTATYTVTFTAELYHGDVVLGSYDHSAEIKGVELKLGYCYDFKASLTCDNIADDQLNPIEFTVKSVEYWPDADDEELDVSTFENE